MTFLLSLALFQDALTLRYEMREEAVHGYRAVFAYETEDDEAISFTEEWRLTVGKPGDDGLFPLEVAASVTEHVFDGETYPASDEAVPMKLSERRDVRGQVRDRSPRPTEPFLLARTLRPLDLVYLAAPVELGQTWERTEGVGDLPAAKWQWTLTAFDKEKATVHMVFAETDVPKPVTAEGDFVISRAKGWPLEAKVTVTGVTMPSDELQVPAKLTLTLSRLP
ncbi:MAG: hypothetical protein KIT11_04430 [Fimbriimonadaceae bacterium]|nr:hypothetical protein [Fimbriimonadaceae bacterium]QYK56858.1 MAG: hypothetical protein KF733_05095 [Fimbriimonadaceae bacterium]